MVIIAFGVYAYIHEVNEPMRIINGHLDNAPIRGACLLLFVSPMLYPFFALVNGIDLMVGKLFRNFEWISTFLLTLVFSFLGFLPFGIRVSATYELTLLALCSLAGATIMIVPMSLWRRWIIKRTMAEQCSACDSSPRADMGLGPQER